MFVRDCMTPNPTTVEPSASLTAALDVLRSFRIRHLPVLSGSSLVGIVTYTDLLRSVPPQGASFARWELPTLLPGLCVKDVMTRAPITVPPVEPVERAAHLLRRHKIGSLLIIERERVVGIVTRSDLFDALLYMLGGDVAGVRMTFALPKGLEDLARLAHLLGTILPDEKRVAVTARVEPSGRRGYLRVATATPLTLAEQLAAADFAVSGLRSDPSPKRR